MGLSKFNSANGNILNEPAPPVLSKAVVKPILLLLKFLFAIILIFTFFLPSFCFGQLSTTDPKDSTNGWLKSVSFVSDDPSSPNVKKKIGMAYDQDKRYFVQTFFQGDIIVISDHVEVSYYYYLGGPNTTPDSISAVLKVKSGSRIPGETRILVRFGLFDSSIPTGGWTETQDISDQWNEHGWNTLWLVAKNTDYIGFYVLLGGYPTDWMEGEVDLLRIDFHYKSKPSKNIFSILTDVPHTSPTPSEFALFQNYPNPFNPSTTIKFSIPSVETFHGTSLHVVLKVFDLLGREVATLVNEEKPPGNYEVNFDGTNLPSGVYFYTLHAGNYTETKKMLLMK